MDPSKYRIMCLDLFFSACSDLCFPPPFTDLFATSNLTFSPRPPTQLLIDETSREVPDGGNEGV